MYTIYGGKLNIDCLLIFKKIPELAGAGGIFEDVQKIIFRSTLMWVCDFDVGVYFMWLRILCGCVILLFERFASIFFSKVYIFHPPVLPPYVCGPFCFGTSANLFVNANSSRMSTQVRPCSLMDFEFHN